MEVKDIVKSYLIANGFDGLCNIDCGCEISDLFPCGESFEYCEPGYKKIINESGDWGITPIATDETSKQDKYMNTVTAQQLNELSKEIHALAVEKGWWGTERSRGEVYALIHSEISEAVEEARKGRPALYKWIPEAGENGALIKSDHPDFEAYEAKPEGEVVEMADLVIRIMDYAADRDMALHEKYNYLKETFSEIKNHKNHLELYAAIHSDLSLCYRQRDERKECLYLAEIIESVEMFCNRYLGYDLWKAVCIKHEYNKTRPYRHGGKKY